MIKYVLTPTAQQDLAAVRDYYLEAAGYRVARQMMVEFVESFRFLARNPGAGHTRQDLLEDRPLLVWPMRGYLILYTSGSKPLQVIAIVCGSRDLPRIMGNRIM